MLPSMPDSAVKASTRTNGASSSDVLQRHWAAFAERYRQAHGKAPSKQLVSQVYFLDDKALLSRWTTAHDKPKWRIPIRRISEAAYVFELTPEQVEELMVARLQELELGDPYGDVVVVTDWCAEVFKDAVFLNPEEQRVLKAFREAAKPFEGGVRCAFSDEKSLTLWFENYFTGAGEPREEPLSAQQRAQAVEVAKRAMSAVARRAPQAQDQRHKAPLLRERQETRSHMRVLLERTRRAGSSER